jgi:hypothetical protein
MVVDVNLTVVCDVRPCSLVLTFQWNQLPPSLPNLKKEVEDSTETLYPSGRLYIRRGQS